MRWKKDLREERSRTRFLLFPRSIGEDTRWLERVSWVERWYGPESGWEPVAFLDGETLEEWQARRDRAGEKQRDELVEELAQSMGHSSIHFVGEGPRCVCGASPCRPAPGTCDHSRIVSCFDGHSGKTSWACHGCGISGEGPSPNLARQLDLKDGPQPEKPGCCEKGVHELRGSCCQPMARWRAHGGIFPAYITHDPDCTATPGVGSYFGETYGSDRNPSPPTPEILGYGCINPAHRHHHHEDCVLRPIFPR